MFKVIYQKANGEVFERTRFSLPNANIGEHTSMGWLVLDILYYKNDGYYSLKKGR